MVQVLLLLPQSHMQINWEKKPLAIIKSYGHSGCDPAKMGIGPALAIPRALHLLD